MISPQVTPQARGLGFSLSLRLLHLLLCFFLSGVLLLSHSLFNALDAPRACPSPQAACTCRAHEFKPIGPSEGSVACEPVKVQYRATAQQPVARHGGALSGATGLLRSLRVHAL